MSIFLKKSKTGSMELVHQTDFVQERTCFIRCSMCKRWYMVCGPTGQWPQELFFGGVVSTFFWSIAVSTFLSIQRSAA
jgi:hypothetical protein